MVQIRCFFQSHQVVVVKGRQAQQMELLVGQVVAEQGQEMGEQEQQIRGSVVEIKQGPPQVLEVVVQERKALTLTQEIMQMVVQVALV
jgi:hypothetical protein